MTADPATLASYVEVLKIVMCLMVLAFIILYSLPAPCECEKCTFHAKKRDGA